MRWRNPEKSFPEQFVQVLCCIKDNNGNKSIVIGYWMNRWIHASLHYALDVVVVAWMPLPAMPLDGKTGTTEEDYLGSPSRFNGAYYNPKYDNDRLSRQMGRIFHLMEDGQWRTLREIANVTKDPEASISAQLRHLRKPRFGEHTVDVRNRGDRQNGLFEYKLIVN